MDQYVVMDQRNNCEVYRNWNHCYSRDTMTQLMNKNGFRELEFYADVAGADYHGMSENLCVAAEK